VGRGRAPIRLRDRVDQEAGQRDDATSPPLSDCRPLATDCGDEYRLLYPPEVVAPYFKSSTDQQIAHFVRSLEAANEFLREHPKEGLVAGKGKPKGLAGALQYFKDEMFLTLYAFISLDLAGRDAHLAERERLLTGLLHLALPHLDISVTAPSLELEKQVSPPRGYSEILGALFSGEPESCHPVWYLRALGTGNGSLEGATHSDAMLTYAGNRTIMFEAKFLSDISASTTYAPERDQLTRNLDAGLAAVGFKLERFSYVFVTPQRFRERPESRFYGYKLGEYMKPGTGAAALERDLPHLIHLVDFAELSRHIGWVSWEEICGLLAASPVFMSPAFPHEAFEGFFRERCLWSEGATCSPATTVEAAHVARSRADS
jgi:hypothetical protein